MDNIVGHGSLVAERLEVWPDTAPGIKISPSVAGSDFTSFRTTGALHGERLSGDLRYPGFGVITGNSGHPGACSLVPLSRDGRAG